MYIFLFIFLGLTSDFSIFVASDGHICPMNFDSLSKMVRERSNYAGFALLDVPSECKFLLGGIRAVRSDYLQRTGLFTLKPNQIEPCWNMYQFNLNETLESFDVRSNCGVVSGWMSDSCLNISTRVDFEALIPKADLVQIKNSCDRPLFDDSSCKACQSVLGRAESAYFHSFEIGNISDCAGFVYIYTAAFANRFGPIDLGTLKCLFSLDLTLLPNNKRKRHKNPIRGVLVGGITGFFVAVFAVWILCRKRSKNGMVTSGSRKELPVSRFKIEELKKATNNFSRENLIGTGGYGNVYRGVFMDGSEFAMKRFKNCSPGGDEEFKHEVEVIASIRHVNIVALRGYCTQTLPMEGHQRIIVCDLMRNGNLSDHLFGDHKLSWPIRRKIAMGIAHGLAYLHVGLKPSIIHRDVKASNVLLDEEYEPKLSDFGLAKFTPDGFSHLSTRVAGTLGYVAPEYALYGQLTKKSDVYSFGVLLLEILSGKRAVEISVDKNRNLLLTDWAWMLVREGRVMDLVEGGLEGVEPPEVMEKYVVVGVLCAHPVLQARPSMDQVVNMLESDVGMVPAILDRTLSIADKNTEHTDAINISFV